ncbi:hypothetical protein [Streptomyces sp. NPDC059063]|uniref:hypothetical protein n=1 Tax=unclassified Streptomyces TaxID=2593676 RepID=UPI0036D18112
MVVVARGAGRMPVVVVLAVGGVFLQAVGHGWAAVGVLDLVDERLAHGRDVPGADLVRGFMRAWIGVAGGMFLIGVCALMRFAWARIAVVVVECVLGLMFLVPLGYLVLLAPLLGADLLADVLGFSAWNVTALVLGLVLAVAIGRAMFSAAALAWFTR